MEESTTAVSEESGEAGTGGDDAGMRLDVAATGDGDGDGDAGCEALDFLFIVDSSTSMWSFQQELAASFGPFMDVIESSLDTVETIHVGVITADEYPWNATGCQSLGSLVTDTDGGSHSQGNPAIPPVQTACGPFVEGHRFMTEQDDLTAGFDCVAGVGSSSPDYERPITGLGEAVSPAMNAAGGCNEGFLRSNAPLVVVVLTDDVSVKDEPDQDLKEDSDPTKDTSAWRPTLLAAKSNDESAIVVVGFLPWGDTSCGLDPATPSSNIPDFVESFQRHVLASVCEPDYASILQGAVDEIKTSCDEFVPPD
jgi:hypothetical protein